MNETQISTLLSFCWLKWAQVLLIWAFFSASLVLGSTPNCYCGSWRWQTCQRGSWRCQAFPILRNRWYLGVFRWWSGRWGRGTSMGEPWSQGTLLLRSRFWGWCACPWDCGCGGCLRMSGRYGTESSRSWSQRKHSRNSLNPCFCNRPEQFHSCSRTDSLAWGELQSHHIRNCPTRLLQCWARRVIYWRNFCRARSLHRQSCRTWQTHSLCPLWDEWYVIGFEEIVESLVK